MNKEIRLQLGLEILSTAKDHLVTEGFFEVPFDNPLQKLSLRTPPDDDILKVFMLERLLLQRLDRLLHEHRDRPVLIYLCRDNREFTFELMESTDNVSALEQSPLSKNIYYGFN